MAKGRKLSPRQREALDAIRAGRFYPCLVREGDGWHARWRAAGSADSDWVDEYVRTAAVTPLTEDAEDQRHETLHDAWIAALRSRTGLVAWDDAECAAFALELEAWSGCAKDDEEARRRIVFTFQASPDGLSLACGVPAGRRGLRALGQATYVWGPLREMRTDGHGSLRLDLSQSEAEDFFRCGARDLRDAGYAVEGADIAATVDAKADVGEDDGTTAAAKPKIRLTVRVAGEPVTADEIRFLLDQGSSLVFFRDRWIRVDRGILREALRALEKGTGKKQDAMHFALGLGHVGGLEISEAHAHGGLRGLLADLRRRSTAARPDGKAGTATDAIPGFKGELRDYQRRGVEWLRFLTGHGFGALLADDMGLGKTVQTIAWLLADERRGPALVVAPLTLLANWRHEFARFAPSLKVYLHHGDSRHIASGFRRAVEEADVTLTSYTLLVKDYTSFSEIEWDALAIDEAQSVKNPDTQTARAVRALTPPRRVAITGTPIENSAEDIWSIEEFLNPGMLGERKAFMERFARPIAADAACAAGRRLRHALEPFVLRRLKSDRRIAAELGPKREIRDYCELSAEQRAEYEAELADFRAKEHAPGDVFALLTRLKLVCDGAGKVARLCDLLEAIFENGESALVFTQYAKVGASLQAALAERFGRSFPFLHGGLSAAERETEIARFASGGPTAFILSLKAGGFGLNLTKATHVIHFDRWWNPAVENQATDRAHRIGQQKTVFVHLMITVGTLEERVDELLARKARVAGAVITEAEWLEAAGA
ncbi:MAG: hypothetical protein IKF72_09685 [Kiritimatiellae bacterium]|nr:hypothetical protein [Kiritimatiellia bacterium]